MKNFRYAVIVDEFTELYFKGIKNVLYLTPQNWEEEISEFNPNILFVESAWRGNKGKWLGMLNKSRKRKEILELIDWCNKHSIKTLFWNKEDPVHFRDFVHLAKKFDVILTTDIKSIEAYKKHAPNAHIEHLPFCINPLVYNPVEHFEHRKKRFCFTGSYYVSRYQERKNDFDRIITCADKYGIDIYDRNLGNNSTYYRYPNRYKKYIVGTSESSKIQEVYKMYRCAVNVCSIKYSSTMFPRRIIECLACGTPVVSSYSKSIDVSFKNIILSSDNPRFIDEEMEKIMMDDEYYLDKKIRGVREVLSNFIFEEKMVEILKNIGFKVNYKKTEIGLIREDIFHGETEKIERFLENFDHEIIAFDEENLLDKDRNKDIINAFKGGDVDGVSWTGNYDYRKTQSMRISHNIVKRKLLLDCIRNKEVDLSIPENASITGKILLV